MWHAAEAWALSLCGWYRAGDRPDSEALGVLARQQHPWRGVRPSSLPCNKPSGGVVRCEAACGTRGVSLAAMQGQTAAHLPAMAASS